MNRVVVDTNIIFAALRAKYSKVRAILDQGRYLFYTPNFLIAEIFKHKERILRSSKSSEEETYEYLIKTLNKLSFVNENIISTGNFIAAYKLCKEIDEDDTPFVALSLELDCELWTKDEKLKEGLRRRGFNKFFEEPE